MFPARLQGLRAIRSFVERFCEAAGISREPCLRLNLVLEELFTNTVRHGHRKDCDAPVWVTLVRVSDAVGVVYEDTAPPFNPYARLPHSHIAPASTLELRKLGGLGVLLTRELAASRDYTYIFGRNRIRLSLMLH